MFMAFPQQNGRILRSVNTELVRHIPHVHAFAILFLILRKKADRSGCCLFTESKEIPVKLNTCQYYMNICIWTLGALASADQQH